MKKMKQSQLLMTFLILFMYQNTLLGQGAKVGSIHEKLILPSPEASDLGKYGDMEFNYHSGVPNISIPIYTIKGKEISLPISLTYDASGRQVAEVASNVGLGWTLQAGGIITRTVRGLPDELATHGYFDAYPLWVAQNGTTGYMFDFVAASQTHPATVFANEAYAGNKDLLPDVYHFNFNGHSGKIMFDPYTKDPIVIPQQNIKIERSFTTNNWTITTGDGTIYTFNQSDAETTHMSNGLSANFLSAWHLTSIQNYNQTEEIRFVYEDFSSNQSTPRHTVHSAEFDSRTPQNVPVGFNLPTPTADDLDKYDKKRLIDIYYNNLAVTPNASLLHVDLAVNETRDDSNGYTGTIFRYDWIKVEKIVDGGTDELLKKFDFSYSYFIGSGTDNKRLKLDQVKESDKPPYLFEYDLTQLPPYESFSKDHWGYYNAAPNTNLIPAPPAEYTMADYYLETQPNVASANRNSNATGSLSNLLTKITYPTGGHADYTYEVNKSKYLSLDCGNVVTHTVKAYGDETLHGTMTATELQIRSLFDDGDTQLEGGLPNVKAKKITVSGGLVKIRLEQTPGSTLAVPSMSLIYEDPLPSTWDDYIEFYPYEDYFVTLPAGDYYIVSMVGEDPALDNIWTEMTLTTYVVNSPCTSVTVSENIGGARIKKIEVLESAGAETTTYEYKYIADFVNQFNVQMDVERFQQVGTEPESQTLSDVLDEVDESLTSTEVFYRPDYLEIDYRHSLIVSAHDNNPFAKVNGSHVGYKEVAVIKNGIRNGVSIYKYRGGVNPNFRSLPEFEAHYVYKSSNKKLEIKKSTESITDSYEYPDDVPGNVLAITDLLVTNQMVVPTGDTTFFYACAGDCTYSAIYEVGYGNNVYYNYGTSFLPITEVIDKTYEGGEELTMETKNYYDFTSSTLLINAGIKLTQVTRQEIDNGINGKKTYVKYFYPHSYDESLSYIQDKYISDLMIRQESGIIEGSTHYKTAETINVPIQQGSHILVDRVYEYRGSSPLDQGSFGYTLDQSFNGPTGSTPPNYVQRASFDYDVNSTAVIHRENSAGVDDLYLWGYNDQYPIVHITNAELADLPGSLSSTLRSHQFTGNTETDCSYLNGQLTTLRANQNFQVTSYTYDAFVGMTSQTGPNGRTIYYVYDDYGRLAYVKDDDGNIIQKNEYKYKN